MKDSAPSAIPVWSTHSARARHGDLVAAEVESELFVGGCWIPGQGTLDLAEASPIRERRGFEGQALSSDEGLGHHVVETDRTQRRGRASSLVLTRSSSQGPLRLT